MATSLVPDRAIHAPKRLLFGPGPSMVEPRVYQALSQPVVGHLDPYFFEVAAEVRGMLRQVFGTKNEWTIPVSGTGSSGMQAAVANFVEPGTKLGVFANGYFCDRISEMGRRQGAAVVRCEQPWGEVFSASDAAEFIAREKPQVVAFVHAETSTGALQPPKAICDAAHEAGAIVIADTVTSLGAVPVNVDANGIDVAYSCTQKGLSCPPGLAPITVSPRAVERLRGRKSPIRDWYLDLNLLMEYYDGRKYHHTASATLFYGLHQALQAIMDEGLANRFHRHMDAHNALVRGFSRLGLTMHVPEGHRIPNLNTPRVPEGASDAKIRKTLLEEHGIEIAGGFGPLAGKIFRIGLMGPLATAGNIEMFLTAFGSSFGA